MVAGRSTGSLLCCGELAVAGRVAWTEAAAYEQGEIQGRGGGLQVLRSFRSWRASAVPRLSRVFGCPAHDLFFYYNLLFRTHAIPLLPSDKRFPGSPGARDSCRVFRAACSLESYADYGERFVLLSVVNVPRKAAAARCRRGFDWRSWDDFSSFRYTP